MHQVIHYSETLSIFLSDKELAKYREKKRHLGKCTCSVNSLCRKDVIDTDFRSFGDFICHFVGCSTVKQHSGVSFCTLQTLITKNGKIWLVFKGSSKEIFMGGKLTKRWEWMSVLTINCLTSCTSVYRLICTLGMCTYLKQDSRCFQCNSTMLGRWQMCL